MKTRSDIEQDVTKDIHISILQDTLKDLRTENGFIKRITLMLFILLSLSIAGIIFQGLYHQHRMFKFLGEVDFNSEIFMDNDASNQNNMLIERK